MKNILLVSFIWITSCSGIKDITGIYRDSNNDNFSQTKYSFKEDSILEITHWSEFTGEMIINGNWFVQDDTVLTPNNLDIDEIVTYSFDNDDDITNNFTVFIYDSYDSVGINTAFVSLNNSKTSFKVAGNGEYKLIENTGKIDYIDIKYLSQYRRILYQKGNNILRVFFNFDKSIMTLDYSSKWKSKNKRLIPLDSGFSILIKQD